MVQEVRRILGSLNKSLVDLVGCSVRLLYCWRLVRIPVWIVIFCMSTAAGCFAGSW